MSSDKAQAQSIICPVCHRHCRLREGALGACRARRARNGKVVDENYGRLTSIAVDPIEKKPIAQWRRGTRVVSVGSYGCNLRCPFCQNWEIAQAGSRDVRWREISPDALVDLALSINHDDPGMIGIAYTYNEPLVGWEYVRDCSLLARKAGFANVLVSNGCATDEVIRELAPLIDAANIDLKSWSPEFYATCGGDIDLVKNTIVRLATEPNCHLEVTTLAITDWNDSRSEIEAIASWLADVDPKIVLHVTRFFPRWKLTDRGPTPVERIFELAAIARQHLPYVFVGNC